MTHKSKIKELVGRGLNSYHTKALQQIDRIEKKNKEQSHKISILTNELDNDYLTKTEEGSVISLEHSKEGMVYIDGIEGNTLVNYCTDGAKELTLNGDIDVEGTNVTLNDTIDNGLVDVMCEGNTLVNIHPPIIDVSGSMEHSSNGIYYLNMNNTNKNKFLSMLKPSTQYTVVLDNIVDEVNYIFLGGTTIPRTGRVTVITTPTSVNQTFLHFYIKNQNLTQEQYDNFKSQMNSAKVKCMVLEGDWTNKEIPPYFESMKSVGECEGNKFEILSQNKNFAISSPFVKDTDIVIANVFLEPNTEYTISTDIPFGGGMAMINNTESHTNFIQCFQNWGESIKTFTTLSDLPKGEYKLILWKAGLHTTVTSESWLQLEKGKTSTLYISHSSNKKEILYYNPTTQTWENPILREWDSIEKHSNGKYYYHKRSGEVVLNGSEYYSLYISSVVNTLGASTPMKNVKNVIGVDCIVDKLKKQQGGAVSTLDEEGVFLRGDLDLCYIKINRSKLPQESTDGLKTYLKDNPITIVYPLEEEEVYECTNLDLITYNDITHISNNSTIPCNMKIKNSGYNAIIKPSTLYTVALDTNKSGTIGINLGGTKVTTTNNVATITTPATLTDDSLRLYGKDIKASKVRLLEGDKTNWIPSHFEGMKSSFEDKLQEDGTYKMEILSNNKNLIDSDNLIMNNHHIHVIEKIKDGFKIKTGTTVHWAVLGEFKLKVKPNTNYTLGYTKTMIKNAYEGMDKTSWDVGYTWITTENNRTITEYKAHNNTRTTRTFNSGNNTTIKIKFNATTDIPTTTGEYDFTDISLVEGTVNNEHIPHKSNKIQFSSIEPLRGVGDVKDRFVFKEDGKLYIERNCMEKYLSEFNFGTTEIKGNNFKAGLRIDNFYRQPNGGSNTSIKCDKLASAFMESVIPCINVYHHSDNDELRVSIPQHLLETLDREGVNKYFAKNPHKITYPLAEPYYEEVPFELAKIILEGYENGTLFFDTNIPPTSTVTYAGETPIVKATKLNKTEVLKNTDDINDNIVPYLMDMDYRVVCLQLEGGIENVSMARLFGGTYEMLQRDIQSKRYSKDEYKHRLDVYLSANKITENEYEKLGDMLND